MKSVLTGLALLLAAAPLAAEAQQQKSQASVVAAELTAIANQLSLRPETAIDFSDVSGEYCFNLGLGKGGHMTHYAIEPAERQEDVIDFVNAEPLMMAGIDVARLPRFPGKLESMAPTQWYVLRPGEFDPHHGKRWPFPLLVRASSLE